MKKLTIAIAALLLGVILFNMTTYETAENTYTVVKQFGKIVSLNDTPGLRFKIPFVQSINYIPKNKLMYDSPRSDVITSDKKTMIVDAWCTWHVEDAKLFTSALNANIKTAEGRIDVIIYNAIKNTISNMTQDELIVSRDDPIQQSDSSSELTDLDIKDITDSTEQNNTEVIAISKRLLESARPQSQQYGFVFDDIEVKVLDLPDENKDAVYERMITERNNIAAAYKAQGEAEAQKIRNTTDREVSVLKSTAAATAAKIEAEGEAEYMRILADAYNGKEKSDYYLFVKSLDTAKKALKNGENTLFLDKDSPLAQIFLQDK